MKPHTLNPKLLTLNPNPKPKPLNQAQGDTAGAETAYNMCMKLLDERTERRKREREGVASISGIDAADMLEEDEKEMDVSNA